MEHDGSIAVFERIQCWLKLKGPIADQQVIMMTSAPKPPTQGEELGILHKSAWQVSRDFRGCRRLLTLIKFVSSTAPIIDVSIARLAQQDSVQLSLETPQNKAGNDFAL